ncbi:MAG: HD domain-containing protein [Desulfobacterales bacterium]|nr:HD domain-containing protein [Desulfobacterales bacterium]
MLVKYQQFFEAFTGICQSVRQGRDTDTVLSTLLDAAVGLFDAKGGTLRLLEPATGELILRTAVGLSSGYLDKGPVMADASLSEIYEKEPVVIGDAACDPRVQYPRQAAEEGIRAIVAFPFGIFGRVRMVLRLYFTQPVTLSDEEIGLVRSMAEQGAIVLRNTLVHSRYFDSFREISKAIHAGSDTGAILQAIVGQVTDIMEALGAIFWITDTSSCRIQTKVCHGFSYQSLSGVDYDMLERLFLSDGERVAIIADARYDTRLPDLERMGKRRVRTILGVPLPIVEPYQGILAVYFARTVDPIPGEIQFLRALGEQGAIALHKALRYDENMLQTFRETVEGFALALEAKDIHTHGHSLKVAHYARLTARAMGLDPIAAETVYRAGLLHDIGKIGMADRLLVRLGKLTPREMCTLRTHPVIGARIVAPLRFLSELAPLIRHHHERWDGSGYPDKKQGRDIPLGARIIAVCDAFDTMVSGRPNMARMSLDQALDQVRFGAGTRFDSRVVTALVDVAETHPEAVTPLDLPESYLAKYGDEMSAPVQGDLQHWLRNLTMRF